MTDSKENHERFFSEKPKERSKSHGSISLEQSDIKSEDDSQKGCRTLRIIQRMLPCMRRKGVWEPSQGDLFKSHDAEEARYPRILRILENPVLDCIFVTSCLLSIYLFLFSEGFLLESRLLWGIMHLVNAVYAIGLFVQWLQILIKSKYAKTNHGYTTRDIVYTLLSVFPADLIVLAIYTLNDADDNDDVDRKDPNPITSLMITISRLNYFLRIRNILQHFSKWEDHLVVGDFKMFLMRTFFFATLLIHMFACIWHRIACDSFQLSHFKMTSDEATVEVCKNSSWIGLLHTSKRVPLLDHPTWPVLVTHYLVSVYWTIIATFRLGASDIKTSLVSNMEVGFVSLVEITAWIFVVAIVNGTLASLLIEKDTEKQNFLTRCFAIRHYLHFGEIAKTIQDDVTRFYNYLWERSSGLVNTDLVDLMPHAMKSEVFYDVNKFVLDQLPILKGLETPFLMSLSVRTNHRFYMSGEILFRKNETAFAMYYLVKGHLEVLSEDEKHILTTIRCGSAIGEIYLLQPYLHVATFRCGSDCEIRTLSRKHFNQVLKIYPQYVQVLEQRLESRLEQSGLLLALCEKHNTYQKAFKALREFEDHQRSSLDFQQHEFTHSFENVTKILSAGMNENIATSRYSYDFDGMTLSNDIEERINRSITSEGHSDKKGYEDMWYAACEALETDVARAGALANDLNIPRPPIIVSVPSTATHVTLGFKQADSENVCVSLTKRLKDPSKGSVNFAWTFLVSLCALLVFWFYPFQFAFSVPTSLHLDYCAHITDVIFALDCFYDMIQIVVTPQKTFESANEITLYRLKSLYFYMRVFSFIPFEYIFAPLVGYGGDEYPYFYLFKLNRMLEIHLVNKFLVEFETRFGVKPIVMVMGKLALGLFFVTHIFTVLYAFVSVREDLKYLGYFYWALVIVTSLGYGDYPAQTNGELTVEVVGLVVGVSSLIFMAAKVTSMLVNSERKRISFKQTFYALEAFMRQRNFPRTLTGRVSNYYSLQWRAHEGTLIPTGRSIMWDAPKSVITRVCYSHAHKYVCRIPLFQYAPIFLQNEICVALKHYVVPPRETLLHSSELARELYIISKGYVEVCKEGKRIAVFSEGRYFGLNGLLMGVNTQYMFRTLTHCQLFCLSHDSFMKVANSNPNFLHELELLTGEDTLSPFQTLYMSAKESELPAYPSKEYLDKLVVQLDMSRPEDEFLKMSTNAVVTSYIRSFSLRKCYLLPNGVFLKWWMGFRLMFALFVTIFAPAQVAFPVEPRISFFVILAFDIVAWIDMLISLRVAYYGDKNQLVTDSCKMATHYLKGPFVIDVLACFPADLVVYLYLSRAEDYNQMYHLISLLRLNRMLQFYKVLVMNSILEKLMFKSLSLMMLVEMAPLMFLFINVTTFMCVIRVCGVPSNSQPIKCNEDAWIFRGLKRLNHDSDTDSKEELRDPIRAYLVGLYWVTQSVLSVGYGDIEIGPHYTNQIVATAVIFIGVLSASYAISKLTSCIVGEDPAKIELQEKMALMNNYLEQQRTSRTLRRRVRETYLNAWDKTKGVSPTNLFLALPPALKTDVMKHLYGSTLKCSLLFQYLDGPGIRMLASSLQEIFYPEGEFLMKFGDLCDDVFFIAHGAVVCYNVRGVIISQLGGGSLIGEIAPFFQTHRLYTAIAVKDVNAYVFKREAFMNFLNQYPDMKTLLETYSLQHYREAMQAIRKTSDYEDVLLSYQNEKMKNPTVPTGKATGATSEQDSINHSPFPDADNITPVKEEKKIQAQAQHTFTVPGGEQDLTRNYLKEDVLKSPDDLAKGTAETWWSVVVTFGRMARDEMGFVHICQELGHCSIFNFTVHPASHVCNWVSLYMVLTSLSCSITAYEIAFERDGNNATQKLSETVPIIALRDCLEVFFAIRIIGNFHLAYYDETATLITSVKTISHKYAYQIDGLWLDAVTTFPFYYLFKSLRMKRVTEFVRSLHLLRVFLFVRYLQASDSSLRMKASRAKILKITILLCFIFHFWACAWYLVACFETNCTVGSWMHKTLNELKITDGTDPNKVTVWSRYLLSLYYVSNALTSTGFAHITARTNIELCLSIMMMFGTVFVIGYLVGEMAQCLASQVATKIHYQHKLSVLENHFTSLGISYEKISEVRDYFKLLWCRCKGVMLYNLMEELPYSLRADVAMEIYGPNLRNSRILGKLDENLIRQIAARIRHEIFFPGSHIVRAGDVCSSMYFIKKGEVVILDGNSNLELCVEILYENECFGEVKIILPDEQYRFSYVARLESEVGVLYAEDLEAVLKNHPRIWEEVKEKARKIKARRQSLKDEEEPGGDQPSKSITSVKKNQSGVQDEKRLKSTDKF